jgi:hypothetical protein
VEAQVQGVARGVARQRPGPRLPFRHGVERTMVARSRQRFLLDTGNGRL